MRSELRGRRLRRILGLILGSTSALLVLGPVAAQAEKPALRGGAHQCLIPLAEYPLPAVLQKATDVRWADPETVFVSSWRTGVFRLKLSDVAQPPVLEINRGNGLNDIWLPVHIAASREYLAVGAPVFALAWKRRAAENLAAQVAFAAIVDIDLFEERLLVLGARRDEKGQFAPDGAMAWEGPLSEDLAGLRPVLYSQAGARVRPMNDCGVMEIGSVRFLPDGSFVVVPGVEPGVMHYGPSGQLLRTWQSEVLGLDAGCGLTEEERKILATDEPARWAWVNDRRTVDDILPLAEGPGLLARTRGPEETTWQLKILDRGSGGVTTCDVPVSSPSGLAQLHGDMIGDRIVFLLWARGPGGRRGDPPVDLDAPPEIPPRLVLMQLRR